MPGVRIHGGEFTIGKLLSDDFHFSIPLYQRPYSWTTEQASELIADLLSALRDGEADVEALDPYFLGSVVLIKTEGDPAAEIVDGQQRLTTLTILLATLNATIPNEEIRASLKGRLFQQGDALTGMSRSPRLRLRELDRAWFEKYVQAGDELNPLLQLDLASLTAPRRNVQENARLFLKALQAIGPLKSTLLARFLITNTYVVVVTTPSLDSAYRIFSVLNERGLELTAPDILKAEVIGKIPAEGQKEYSAKWEAIEEPMEPGQFSELFAHIRMTFGKTKLRETVLTEFRDQVLLHYPDPRLLVDEVIGPYADAFGTVRQADFVSAQQAEIVNTLLRWLNRLDNFDWVPPAISFIRAHPNDGATVRPFLEKLERLAASMLIRRATVNERIERYGQVLAEIEADGDFNSQTSAIQLTDEEKKKTLEDLDRDIYPLLRVRLYVLLRLDSAVSGGGAAYDYPILTIEHVLPQAIDSGSEWEANFDEVSHLAWVHRLANLVLLTRRKNSQAQNYDFDVKKHKYFSDAGGISPFVLTTQVLGEPRWTTAVLEERQKKLLATLATLWGLA